MKDMDVPIHVSIVFLLFIICRGGCDEYYSNEWLVQSPVTGQAAELLARRHGFYLDREVIPGYLLFRRLDVPRRSKQPSDWTLKTIGNDSNVLSIEQQVWRNRVKRSTNIVVSDPKWPSMWYLNGGTSPSLGVLEAWNKGYNGSGITVAVVDDGVELNHNDLKANVDFGLSYDTLDGDADPTPVSPDKHGTECAGILAAVKNNVCVIGVAFNARLAGIRVYRAGYGSTDASEASGLKHGLDKISVFSNSWGVDDRTVFDGPKGVVKAALKQGIDQGRNKKGSIYVWAAGNGGFDDNCNCDGFVNSIYTVSIGVVSETHQPPGYAEQCSAILASTYSGGGGGVGISTTDSSNGCTTSFTGTSAATPMAAGIVALALQANPELTWRDVQHLIINTTTTTGLKYGGFKTNGIGLQVSHNFGFGLMNAEAMVDLAPSWTLVPRQRTCSSTVSTVNRGVDKTSTKRTFEDTIVTDGCEGTDLNHVEYLEHVEARIKFFATTRGHVEITLKSPAGTESKLLTRRKFDNKKSNVELEWTYMSVHYWGESPKGSWVLTLALPQKGEEVRLETWNLILYGTNIPPWLGRENESTVSVTFATTTETGHSHETTTPTVPGNQPPPPPPPPPPTPRPGLSTCEIVIIVVCSCIGVLFVIFVIRLLYLRKQRKEKAKVSMTADNESSNIPSTQHSIKT